MSMEMLDGHVTKNGYGDASNWGLAQIRELTGYSLEPGTLNVKLDAPHQLRVDFTLPKEARMDRRPEDLYFERCRLVMERGTVRVLIARTSTNAWGDTVLEIMAEVHLRTHYHLADHDSLRVKVWVGTDAAAEAEADSRIPATVAETRGK